MLGIEVFEKIAKVIDTADLRRCEEVGAALAAGLEMGLF